MLIQLCRVVNRDSNVSERQNSFWHKELANHNLDLLAALVSLVLEMVFLLLEKSAQLSHYYLASLFVCQSG